MSSVLTTGRVSSVAAQAQRRFGKNLVRESPAPYGDAQPGPLEDADALDAIKDKVIKLAAHIHAAEHRLLVLILEFDKRRGWEIGGHRNCTDWLHAVTGLDRGAAGQRVRAARALETLPQVSDAMSKGQLSFSKVRAISRLHEDLDEVSERVLVDYAKKVNASDLERVVRNWGELTRVDEAELERIRHRKRTFSVFPGDDGMYIVRGVVDPEVGALLMRAIEAGSDALYKAGLSWSAEGGAYGPTTEEVTSEQRRADALALVAERALAAGFGIEVEDGRDEEEEGEPVAGLVNANSRADVDEPCSDDQGGHGSERSVSEGPTGSAERGRPATSGSAPRSGSAGCKPATGDQTGSAERGGPGRAGPPNESEVSRADLSCLEESPRDPGRRLPLPRVWLEIL